MSKEIAIKLFKQKSLYDIYTITNSFDDAPFNKNVFAALLSISTFLIIWVLFSGYNEVKADDSLKFVHISASYGAQLSMTILGFLISGFAIFSSLTKPELFMALASINHNWKGPEITRLQYLFFNFIHAFIVYLSLLFLTTLITAFSSEGSPLSKIHGHFFKLSEGAIVSINTTISIAVLLFVVKCLLVLKSFIWNMYQAILLIILADAEMKQNSQ